jgi:hypothetical protein
LGYNGLHGVISQKTELFTTTKQEKVAWDCKPTGKTVKDQGIDGKIILRPVQQFT